MNMESLVLTVGRMGNRSLISISVGEVLLRMREISCLPRIKIILIFSIIRKMELGRWKPVKK